MSAHKITRDTYKQIYDELIKVIKEDPHLSNTYNLQEEHVEYLEREWWKKLNNTGLFNSMYPEFPLISHSAYPQGIRNPQVGARMQGFYPSQGMMNSIGINQQYYHQNSQSFGGYGNQAQMDQLTGQ